jgi:hypothetical protein
MKLLRSSATVYNFWIAAVACKFAFPFSFITAGPKPLVICENQLWGTFFLMVTAASAVCSSPCDYIYEGTLW